jgi:hypothetical protein
VKPAGVTAVAAAALLLPGCASVQAPPGGPEDRVPPQLVTSRPAADAVVEEWGSPVVLVFDERLSERGIDQAVEVSPRTSGVVVRHSGDELRVSLREGWRPGIVYHLRVLPGLRDLFGNETTSPIRLVFSTGPQIADTRLAGRAVGRTDLEPMPDLRVEAILAADSLVYATSTDSAGRFMIANLPEGDYLVRSFDDLNRNRALDGFEPRDTARATLAVGEPVDLELSVVLPDSTAPRVATATLDGRVVTLTFDDFLDPARDVPRGDVEVRGSAGVAVPVSRVSVGRLAAEGDTATAGPPLPSRELLIELEEGVELRAGAEYTATVRGITNIAGLAADVVATFTPPAEPDGGATPAPDGRANADNPNPDDL